MGCLMARRRISLQSETSAWHAPAASVTAVWAGRLAAIRDKRGPGQADRSHRSKMWLHSVQQMVSEKRSEVNESSVHHGQYEKRDEGGKLRSQCQLLSGDLSDDDSGGVHDEVSVVALNMDKCGRLRLETVDDLFNILQLRKRRRQKKAPVCRKSALSTEMLPDTVEAPLFLAAAVDNKMAVVHKYLNEGGNPDAVDHFQRTALHKASFKGHVEIMITLLDAGATIDRKDKLESTAVHWACRGGSLPALQLLLQRGAKISARDKLHSCPLHVAVRTGHLQCAEYLIHCSADVNARDRGAVRAPDSV
ncbi:ankyrin repeat domain-containing protein 1-like isoform X2 [Syngnathus acus]|uniref:ankyrin repeat domain-containing protein 1-like isoform X2 n=1 Tax=Syngnathus acus TaxID=161584 RepID=UPI0018860C2C|nr:ankyrin repeat domain-containing protein 1-like isoform X2 [Syngnathus acus]